MSEAPEPRPSEPPAKTSLFLKIVLALLLVVITFLFLPAFFMAGRAGVIGAVALGWWSFLSRTLPGISWNWDIAGMGALCLLLALVLAHAFLRWITKGIASARGTTWQWPWRWTWCGLVGVALLFLVGMSVGGAAHQIGWVVGSQEPWYEQRPRYLEDLRQMRELDVEFRVTLMDTNTVAGVRQAIRNSDAERRFQERHYRSLIQSCHILLVSTNQERVDGVIIFPRNTDAKLRLHGYFITDADSVMIATKDLPGLLKEQQPYLIAF